MKPSWYLKLHSKDYLGYTYCRLRFVPSKDPNTVFWTFGTSFLTSHFTVYDAVNGKIGFLPNKFVRVDESVTFEITKITSSNTTFNALIIVLIIIFWLVIVSIVIWRLCVIKKAKASSPKTNDNQDVLPTQTGLVDGQTDRKLVTEVGHDEPIDINDIELNQPEIKSENIEKTERQNLQKAFSVEESDDNSKSKIEEEALPKTTAKRKYIGNTSRTV